MEELGCTVLTVERNRPPADTVKPPGASGKVTFTPPVNAKTHCEWAPLCRLGYVKHPSTSERKSVPAVVWPFIVWNDNDHGVVDVSQLEDLVSNCSRLVITM